MKLVIIINQDLPLGFIANTAAVLGLSLGNRIPDLIGPDIPDKDGSLHLGITRLNIPVLGASREIIKNLREGCYQEAAADLTLIDFNTVAQRSKYYEDYTSRLAAVPREQLEYLGLCIYGAEKRINKLTGSLQLLR